MSEITDLLTSQVEHFKNKASAPAAEVEMIKLATVTSLIEGGIDTAEAESLTDSLIDRACPDLQATLEKSAQFNTIATILEKAASYIAELETKLEDSTASIIAMEKAAEADTKAPSVSALEDTGMFTNEDLQALRALEGNTLSKVASHIMSSPRAMGGPSNRISADIDAFTQFLTE
tara:strand:+ start:596 stop:1123 length:528 start_codon:yes stop_codon:yes gene_type:complete